jgi:hypothetical protein
MPVVCVRRLLFNFNHLPSSAIVARLAWRRKGAPPILTRMNRRFMGDLNVARRTVASWLMARRRCDPLLVVISSPFTCESHSTHRSPAARLVRLLKAVVPLSATDRVYCTVRPSDYALHNTCSSTILIPWIHGATVAATIAATHV